MSGYKGRADATAGGDGYKTQGGNVIAEAEIDVGADEYHP